MVCSLSIDLEMATKNPLAGRGSGSGEKLVLSDHYQPSAPRMCVVVIIMVIIMPPMARGAAAQSSAKETAKGERFDIGIPNLTIMGDASTRKRGKREYFALRVANGIQIA
jgi:hypothetical protein